MAQYVDDAEDAITRLLGGVYVEESRIAEIEKELRKRRAQVQEARKQESFLAQNPDLDDEGLGALHRWEGYFGEGELIRMERDIQRLEQEREDRLVSINPLAGAVLQIAKQGISLKHGKRRTDCPNLGRNVGNQPLRDVIWAGRNQAIHYEDGSFDTPTTDSFAQLEADFGPEFDLASSPPVSRASDVVKVLGWTSYQHFATDVNSLL